MCLQLAKCVQPCIAVGVSISIFALTLTSLLEFFTLAFLSLETFLLALALAFLALSLNFSLYHFKH